MQKTIADLLDPITKATISGKLEWKSDRGSGFVAALSPTQSIHVWEYKDPEDDSEGISLGLRNIPEGSFLDTYSRDEFSTGYGKLYELYKSARRSALNVDKVIEDLEGKLNKLLGS